MIAFATVDGELHKREYQFLGIVANELKITKSVFDYLFHQEMPLRVIRVRNKSWALRKKEGAFRVPF